MHLSKLLLFFGLCVLAVFIISCATIIKGTSQDISINSSPTMASVVVKTTGGVEVFTGTTPTTAKLSKKKEYIATISLEGYKETTVQITQSFEAWTIGNLLCGGVLRLVIDAVDGAMWKLEPEQIMVSLVTASIEGGESRLYAVFRTLDDQGQLRTLSVPLIKEFSFAKH
ncbi:MAG: hypothetical protein QME52_08725 [Bacteroidota bacterium]|nr:hypothetical protein [Bacteroidota bacterium]